AERARTLCSLLGAGATAQPSPPAWWGWQAGSYGRPGANGQGAAEGQPGSAVEPGQTGTLIRIAFWSAGLARVVRMIDTAARAAGLDPAVGGSAAAGVIYAGTGPQADPAAVAAFVAGLRAAVARGDADARPATAPAPDSPPGPASAGAGQRRRGARPARRAGSDRPVGPGAVAAADARGQGPVRPGAPDVAGPVRRRDLMDDPASPLDPGGYLAAAASDCVHCGFCLPACPTYQLWGEEMDSPRGRIHLMSQVLAGAPVTDRVMLHLDRCLGCMACVPACPSGVRYNDLIEAARGWPDQAGADQGDQPGTARSLRERAVRAAIFATFPYPKRLRALTGPLRAAQRARLDRLVQRGPVARYAPELAGSLSLAPRSAGRPG